MNSEKVERIEGLDRLWHNPTNALTMRKNSYGVWEFDLRSRRERRYDTRHEFGDSDLPPRPFEPMHHNCRCVIDPIDLSERTKANYGITGSKDNAVSNHSTR